MATIGTSQLDLFFPGAVTFVFRDLSLIEWLEREALKPLDISRKTHAETFQWSVIRIPRPNRARTDDMRQMIEDLANARRD